MAGQKIFPEFFNHEDKIIVPPRDLDPADYAFFGGFDYGPRNPSSFHVYAKRRDGTGPWICAWELYEPCPNIPEFAAKMRACKYYPYLKYIAADPAIWASNQQIKHGNPTSINQLFIEENVQLFVPGITDEEAWIAEMHRHWMSEEPGFHIFSCCPSIIDEFKNAIYADPKSIDKNIAYTDRMADRHNHALDACKYFFNSLPQAGVSQRKRLKYPIMANRYKH
jgi:hypothetical protein